MAEQVTHSSAASSTDSRVDKASALHSPFIVSAKALSLLSHLLPTDGSMLASASCSLSGWTRIERRDRSGDSIHHRAQAAWHSAPAPAHPNLEIFRKLC